MKTILDLGCGYADISGALHKLGADVTAVDARQEHLQVVSKRFKNIKIIRADLDQTWPFRGKKFGLVLDLGLLCHMKNFKKHLIEVCSSTDNLFLETAVCDSDDPEKCVMVDEFKDNYDKSINGTACRPSAEAIEKVLTDCGMKFKRIDNNRFNCGAYIYDWESGNTDNVSLNRRRIWFCNRTGNMMPKLHNLMINSAATKRIVLEPSEPVIALAMEDDLLPPKRPSIVPPTVTYEDGKGNIVNPQHQMPSTLAPIITQTLNISIVPISEINLKDKKLLFLAKGNQSNISDPLRNKVSKLMVFDFWGMLSTCRNDCNIMLGEFLYVVRLFAPQVIILPADAGIFSDHVLSEANKIVPGMIYTKCE